MSKRKQKQDVVFAGLDDVEVDEVQVEVIQVQDGEVEVMDQLHVSIPFPIGDSVKDGFCGRHLDIRLTRVQAQTMRRLQQGLNETDSRMANGKHVDSAADVVRWMLDQVAAVDAGE
jgi:hypothetical protein